MIHNNNNNNLCYTEFQKKPCFSGQVIHSLLYMQVDSTIQGIKEDVTTLRDKWEEMTHQSSVHETKISELIGRELVLNSEVDRYSARVIELETLLQSRETSGRGMESLLTDNRSSLELLRIQIAQAKDEYLTGCQKVINSM